MHASGFGLFPFRSPLLGESLSISFPLGTEMFHFPRFASFSGYSDITRNGLPHSEIPGSMLASSSPRRFAGSCVLLRLSVPRHPPYALNNLPKNYFGLSFFALRASSWLGNTIVSHFFNGLFGWFHRNFIFLTSIFNEHFRGFKRVELFLLFRLIEMLKPLSYKSLLKRTVVDLRRLELLTSRMQIWRSPSWAIGPILEDFRSLYCPFF